MYACDDHHTRKSSLLLNSCNEMCASEYDPNTFGKQKNQAFNFH